MKIDIFPHIWPVKYKEALFKLVPSVQNSPLGAIPMLWDLDARFRVMDKYEDLVQVLTLAAPPIEDIADSEKAVDLVKLANDEMAEIIMRYPDRFVGAAVALPMNNIDARLRELDRAITDLNFRGVQVFTPVNDKPLDSPEFVPLYEEMSKYDLPIWLHPWRNNDYADYRTEERSKYSVFSLFGWPFETTVAMTRLIFSGVFEKWPNLKIITHHCGGMVAFFETRITAFYEKHTKVMGQKYGLTKAPIEYFKMFYNDTALYGGTPQLMLANTFFGANHLLFGTDMPLGDSQLGLRNTGRTIEAIEKMDISSLEKQNIFETNARKLLQLP